MGNQQSNSDGDATTTRRPFGRTHVGGGALGLSRAELDKRCQPSGLYDTCLWEDRAVRKLVGDGKAAARLKGSECRSGSASEECPICFLYYSDINVTKCCNANVCTECFLQVRPQKERHATCPFCNHSKFSISVAKKLSESQLQEREKEEKRVQQARIRARDATGSTTTEEDDDTQDKENSNTGSSTPTKHAFGASLQNDARVASLRARSESFASERSGEDKDAVDPNVIQSLAMTPEERRRLEDEMRAQHTHPLALQTEIEAQERRFQNDEAYSRSQGGLTPAQASAVREYMRTHNSDLSQYRYSNGGRVRRSRGHPLPASARANGSRDWNRIVESFEQGGNGAVQSLDDLVVLEAAILLSMDEEARQRPSGSNSSSDEEGGEFDAAQHAREGFPLVRSLLANQDSGPSESGWPRQRRNQVLRSTGRHSAPEATMETAAMLMRGISEEEQLAMAIAASLQEQGNENEDAPAPDNETNEDGTEGNETTEDGPATSEPAVSDNEPVEESPNEETSVEESPAETAVPVEGSESSDTPEVTDSADASEPAEGLEHAEAGTATMEE